MSLGERGQILTRCIDAPEWGVAKRPVCPGARAAGRMRHPTAHGDGRHPRGRRGTARRLGPRPRRARRGTGWEGIPRPGAPTGGPWERNDHVSPEIRLHRLLNAYPSQVEGKRGGVEQLPLPGPADQVRRTAGCGTARTGRSSSGDARDSGCVPKAPFGGVSPSSTLRGSLGPTAPHRALRDSHPCRAPACAGASGSHVASRRLTRSSFGTKKSWVRIPPFRKLKYQGRGPSVQVALAPLALLCGYRS